MSERHKEWARKARKELLAVLGGKCQWCCSTESLCFDCVLPCGDRHHKMDTSARMCFYRYQHQEQGNLQILCAKCNSRKSVIEESILSISASSDKIERMELLNKLARTILNGRGV